jgi:hypothetical protein
VPASLVLSPNTIPVGPERSRVGLINFVNYTPPERYDQVAWSEASIEEAELSGGPWATIQSVRLEPVDEDPTSPAPRSFSTTNGSFVDGWYRIVFRDPYGGVSDPTLAWRNASDETSQLKPSVQDLGSFMRARTTVAGSAGREAGAFTSQTRPTAVEAQKEIDRAQDMVLMEVGENIPTRLYGQTRWAVTLYAAMLVEIGFYRNEVNKDQSAFAQYQQMYNQAIGALRSAIDNSGPAAPAQGFWSIPVLNEQQAKWQARFKAMKPNGELDPTLLPPDQYFPMGPGGIPPSLLEAYPWLGFGEAFSLGDGLAFLED